MNFKLDIFLGIKWTKNTVTYIVIHVIILMKDGVFCVDV